jgi:hypothetical protein
MYRLLGIPAAALVIVGAPQLIALQGNTSPQPLAATAAQVSPNASPPPAAALTVRLSGHEGMTGDPTLLRVLASGEPSGVSQLFEANGLDTATVTPEPVADCAKARTRATSAGKDQWCLSLEGVGAGHDLTGVVKGGTTLTLTVSRRHSFWAWPFWVLVLGLAAGAVVVIVPTVLLSDVRTVQLYRLIDHNENGPAAERIVGLRHWVDKQRLAGQSAADLYRLVEPVVRVGPKSEQQVRDKLKSVLEASSLEKDSLFVKAAERVANAPNHVSDFLHVSSSGVGVPATEVYPAQAWVGAVPQMDHFHGELDAAKAAIAKLQPQDQVKLTPELTALQVAFAHIDKPGAISHLKTQLAKLETEIAKAPVTPVLPTQAQTEEVLDFLSPGVDILAGGLTGHPDEIPRPRDLKGSWLRLATGQAMLLTGAACVVVVVFAGVTVEQANYMSNLDFASFTDYFKLFSAALTSTAAGTVLGFLGYWRADPATAGGSSAPVAGRKKGA